MSQSLHTVLGANGAIGQAVVAALQQKDLPLRKVQRSATPGDPLSFQADLLDPEQADQAIQGSSHVYFCVGLPYRKEVWQRDFPLLMKNCIDACARAGAVLVFLDNVYLYGPAPLAVPFDEGHPQQPPSQKGLARKKTTEMLLDAAEEGVIEAVIGRAPDFYGPEAVNSQFYISFLERMLEGKAPQTLGRPGIKHTYGFTGDIGRGLVELALDSRTYGQAWHLPVGPPTTFEEMVQLFNKELGTDFQVSFLPPFMRTVLGWFIPPIKEVKEMLYQFDHDYIMSDAKFRTHFPDFESTTYEAGVKAMVASFKDREAQSSNL